MHLLSAGRMLDVYSDNSYSVVARLLHVYIFIVLKGSVHT